MINEYADNITDPVRLALIESLEIVDSPPEEAFDRLTRFAARLANAPVALVSIVVDEYQFFKSFVGLQEPWASLRKMPLSYSFCKHVVSSGEAFVIEDARQNMLVIDSPAIDELDFIAYLGVPLVTRDGEALGALCVIDHQQRQWTQDDVDTIHELARSVMSEIELRYELRLREREQQANKILIADLEAYSHIVAHELKNPIAAILGFSDLLESNGTLNQNDLQAVHYIRCASDQLATIVDTLLSFAAARDGRSIELGDVDMSAIVERAVAYHKQLVQLRNVQFVLPGSLPAIRTHEAWIELVWANYISNAIKYGGLSPVIEIGADVREGEICYWVRDNGIGLTREQQAQMFTAFTRVSETEVEGHGLGLYIVKRIVEKLGGQVGLESKKGKGSRFWFTLPRTA